VVHIVFSAVGASTICPSSAGYRPARAVLGAWLMVAPAVFQRGAGRRTAMTYSARWSWRSPSLLLRK